MNYKFIAIPLAVLYAETVFLGFVMEVMNLYEYIDMIGILSALMAIVVFFVMGCLAKEKRFLHMFYVAFLGGISEIFGVLFFGFSYKTWLLHALIIMSCMLAGYGLSSVFIGFCKRQNKTDKTDKAA